LKDLVAHPHTVARMIVLFVSTFKFNFLKEDRKVALLYSTECCYRWSSTLYWWCSYQQPTLLV